MGRYDRAGMLEPGGIAPREGRTAVGGPKPSTRPKRHSVWDVASGRAPPSSSAAAAIWLDLDGSRAPRRGYCHNVALKIDLDKGTCDAAQHDLARVGSDVVRRDGP